jgi:hypothetical protein
METGKLVAPEGWTTTQAVRNRKAQHRTTSVS